MSAQLGRIQYSCKERKLIYFTPTKWDGWQ